mmetsp:Transcript_27734/g.85736  ORF Transcript_27734/g.85736 Transcript_27734/m.85736 type:complete len:252 (-) Transcript_27734:319-1074(-)
MASRQLPASCSAADHADEPHARTQSGGGPSGLLSTPSARSVPFWMSTRSGSARPSRRSRKPPRPTYFDKVNAPSAVAVTTTSSDRTRRAGNCHVRPSGSVLPASSTSALMSAGRRPSTQRSRSSAVSAAKRIVRSGVCTTNACGRSAVGARSTFEISFNPKPPRSLPRSRPSPRGSAQQKRPSSIQQNRSGHDRIVPFCLSRIPRGAASLDLRRDDARRSVGVWPSSSGFVVLGVCCRDIARNRGMARRPS